MYEKSRISMVRANLPDPSPLICGLPVELIDVIQQKTSVVAHDSVVFQIPFKFQSYLRQSDNGFCEL